VALDATGDTVAIGAATNQADDPQSYSSDYGHVRVYAWVSGAWSQLADDIDGEGKGDASSGMGRAVALSANGRTVAIGAYGNDNEAGNDAGHVRVYDYLSGYVYNTGSGTQ
jgi:hypothetical protein